MWIAFCLVTLVWLSTSQAGDLCEDVPLKCKQRPAPWTRCIEDNFATCRQRLRLNSGFIRLFVNSSQKAEVSPTSAHTVRIPSSALQRSRGVVSGEELMVVAALVNSSFFEPSLSRGRGRAVPAQRQGVVMGGFVLAVRAGNLPVTNLSQPVHLIFRHDKQVEDGTCVFWEESENGGGHWSTDGCDTNNTGTEFVCSCNHLSFFAVLVIGFTADMLRTNTGVTNDGFLPFSVTASRALPQCCSLTDLLAVTLNGRKPSLVTPVLVLNMSAVKPIDKSNVDKRNAEALSYITYIGSSLSVFFLFISLIIYIRLQQRRPEKAISVHMQLTGALLSLHLSFLLCSLWVLMLGEKEEDWVCRGLGLFLHWSLLATFSWTALEGFHLYLLLVKVFNIYVRKYLLKLSLVGWGLPTLTVVICGIGGVYGKYNLEQWSNNNISSTAQICWMSSQFPQRLLVSYVTTLAFPCLVVLCNVCMLWLVVFKLWGLRRGWGSSESTRSWKKINRERGSRLWKDCATVLGLSCVLGLSWGLASTTFISLPWIYVFTILNSLQGVFMFLWSVALSCKSRSENNSSIRDSSSQKMMTTSFNN